MNSHDGEPPLAWVGEVPRSRRFDDVYFSVEDGLAESRHVFLAGNRLAERLALLPDVPGQCFRVAETGFGTGLNILALWDLWRRRGFRHARLEILSVEAWPLSATDIARAHARWPELTELADRLTAVLPPPLPGTHPVALDPGRVMLTLLHGDVGQMLATQQVRIDAWFLDGFAPARNPDMWSDAVFRAIARMSHAETSLATFTSAGAVRRGLEAAGFRVVKVPGHGRKREMITAHFSGQPSAVDLSPPWYRRPDACKGRDAVVIGAGLAGCSAARALAERGWNVTLLERADTLAAGASGNPVGMTYFRPTTRDTAQNRYYRGCWAFALRRIPRVMLQAGALHGRDFSLEGVVSLAEDPRELADLHAFLGTPGAASVLMPVDGDAVPELCAGLRVESPAHVLKGAGWVSPPALCRALADHPSVQLCTRIEVVGLQRTAGQHWRVETATGTVTADVVVVANSLAAAGLGPLSYLRMTPVRGQITLVPAEPATASLKRVINHATYVTPALDGMHSVGATFQPGCDVLEIRSEDDVANIAGLRRALPDWPATDASRIRSRVGIRSASPDYLPYVGPVPDVEAFRDDYRPPLAKGQRRGDLPAARWQPGLFCSLAHGSRGITSALLAAELIGQYANGGLLPADKDVLEAIHPARPLIRAWKRREA